MKKIFLKSLSIIFTLFLMSCGKPVELSNLQNRDGVYYEANAKKPFSGDFFLNYSNGKTEKNGSFKNGVVNGKYISYYKNGQIRIDANYSSGILDGKYLTFYENGENKTSLNYKNGMFNGVNIVYKTLFTPRTDVEFENGVALKKTEYSSQGNPTKISDNSTPNFNSDKTEEMFKAQINIVNIF
ncbi:MAG: toxin-antitoxin system YwqK family antitoxin [Fusobacteriaceae bacterium]